MTGRLRYASDALAPLAANEPFQFARRHALLHYASDSVLTFIPKNGCTSLRVALAQANGVISGPGQWQWIHSNNVTFAAELRDLARALRSLVILRCPHQRLASAFLDKIVRRTPVFWNLSQNLWQPLDPESVTFRIFVDRIARPGKLRVDEHWRPQVDFLVYENHSDWLDFADWPGVEAAVADATGMTDLDARRLSQHGRDGLTAVTEPCFADMPAHEIATMRREGDLPHPRALYDDDLARTVADLYADDIALYALKFGTSGLIFPHLAPSAAENGATP